MADIDDIDIDMDYSTALDMDTTVTHPIPTSHMLMACAPSAPWWV